jgi:hypothetical protein
MAKNILEILKMIKDMETEYLNGKMGEYTMDNGKMVNSTGEVCTAQLMVMS